MKKHVEFGFSILKHSNREIIKAAMHITYEHHEKYDVMFLMLYQVRDAIKKLGQKKKLLSI